MKRALLAALIFVLGLAAGVVWQRQNALWAVLMANAKADQYALATVEIVKDCQPRRGWFKR